MAEFHFYGTWKDSWTVVDAVLRSGKAKGLADRWYHDATGACFSGLDDDLRGFLAAKRSLFLLVPTAEVSRESFVCQRTGSRQGWFRFETKLLPGSLDLTLPACYVEGGVTCLRCGTLSYPREYFDPEGQAWRKPTRQERAFYMDIRDCIRRTLVRIPRGEKSVLGGEDAKTHLLDGTARITDVGI